jgi:hypothetical protein
MLIRHGALAAMHLRELIKQRQLQREEIERRRTYFADAMRTSPPQTPPAVNEHPIHDKPANGLIAT